MKSEIFDNTEKKMNSSIHTCSSPQCRSVNEKVKDCGACRTVAYCSPECQKRDWSFHKHNCRDPNSDIRPHQFIACKKVTTTAHWCFKCQLAVYCDACHDSGVECHKWAISPHIFKRVSCQDYGFTRVQKYHQQNSFKLSQLKNYQSIYFMGFGCWDKDFNGVDG